MSNSKVGRTEKTPMILMTTIGVVALFLILLSAASKSGSASAISSKAPTSTTTTDDDVITKGTVGGVAYLHCQPSSSSSQTTDLVLLHGAKFRKEDWKTSGILKTLCQNYSVTALDTGLSSHNTNWDEELRTVLDAMQKKGLASSLPVTLVTPSASGKHIGDWLLAGDNNTHELQKYIQRWIPVAPAAILKSDPNKLKEVLEGVPVLALYGDQDLTGKKVSNLLGDLLTSAKVVEIKGSHPCYLDSPDAFVKEIVTFINNNP